MVDLWMPEAERLTPSQPGGIPLLDGKPRVVWHSTESPQGNVAFRGVHAWLVKQSSEPHILWDPTTGRIGQYFPANRSARALRNDGTDRTNRTGKVTIQIEVMGRARYAPLKNSPCIGLEKILTWLDSLGVDRAWPAGLPPAPSKETYGVGTQWRSRTTWRTKGGHFGHVHVPNNTHNDPGEVDPTKFEKRGGIVSRSRKPKVSVARLAKAAAKDPNAAQGKVTFPADVKIVERALGAEGLLDKAYSDGHFGTMTVAAYSRWQKRLGYQGKDADGIPGSTSLKALGKKHGFKVGR